MGSLGLRRPISLGGGQSRRNSDTFSVLTFYSLDEGYVVEGSRVLILIPFYLRVVLALRCVDGILVIGIFVEGDSWFDIPFIGLVG